MYVIFREGDEVVSASSTARTLEQAFAQIACKCGYSYRFEAAEAGWHLVIADVERPECSPEPIFSTCIKPRDAQHDLMTQAVDGRLKGHIAVSADDFRRARVMRSGGGVKLQVEPEYASL